MIRKKIIAMSMVAILSIGMITGCGNSSSNSSQSNSSQSSVESSSEDKTDGGKVQEIYDAVVKAYGENYMPNVSLTKEEAAEKFGLNVDDIKDIKAEIPAVGMHVDTFVLIEAKEGKEDAVEKSLNDYRNNLIADTMQYPMNKVRIEASMVNRVDQYIAFILLGKMDDTIEDETKLLEYCKDENKKAVDAIQSVLKK